MQDTRQLDGVDTRLKAIWVLLLCALEVHSRDGWTNTTEHCTLYAHCKSGCEELDSLF